VSLLERFGNLPGRLAEPPPLPGRKKAVLRGGATVRVIARDPARPRRHDGNETVGMMLCSCLFQVGRTLKEGRSRHRDGFGSRGNSISVRAAAAETAAVDHLLFVQKPGAPKMRGSVKEGHERRGVRRQARRVGAASQAGRATGFCTFGASAGCGKSL